MEASVWKHAFNWLLKPCPYGPLRRSHCRYLTGLPGWQGGSFHTPTLPLAKLQDLRYGENPQQQAALRHHVPAAGLAAAGLLQGKELSYNNLNDLNAAWELVSEFSEPAAVAVKLHQSLRVGIASSLAGAHRLAHDADPVSIFGVFWLLTARWTRRPPRNG